MDRMPNFSKSAWKALSTEKTNIPGLAKILKKNKLKVVHEDEVKNLSIFDNHPSPDGKFYKEFFEPKYDAEVIKKAAPCLVKLVDTVIKVLQGTNVLPSTTETTTTPEEFDNIRKSAQKDVETCMEGILAAHEEFLRFVDWETAPLTKKQNIYHKIDELQKKMESCEKSSKKVELDNKKMKEDMNQISKQLKVYEEELTEYEKKIKTFETFVQDIYHGLDLPETEKTSKDSKKNGLLSQENLDKITERLIELQNDWMQDLDELEQYKEYIAELAWISVSSTRITKLKRASKRVFPPMERNTCEVQKASMGKTRCEKCGEILDNVARYFEHQQKIHEQQTSARTRGLPEKATKQ